jgi:hypothetical protein
MNRPLDDERFFKTLVDTKLHSRQEYYSLPGSGRLCHR